MRTFTVAEEPKEEPKCARDLRPGTWFRSYGTSAWYVKTDDDRFPVVAAYGGTLYPEDQSGHWRVAKVLAPGESLAIGPEVADSK